MSRLTFLNCSVQFLKKVKIRCVASIYSAYYQGTEVDWVRVYGGTRSYLFAKVSLGRRRRRGRKSRDKEGRRGEGGMHAKQEKPGAQNLNTNPVWRVFCELQIIFLVKRFKGAAEGLPHTLKLIWRSPPSLPASSCFCHIPPPPHLVKKLVMHLAIPPPLHCSSPQLELIVAVGANPVIVQHRHAPAWLWSVGQKRLQIHKIAKWPRVTKSAQRLKLNRSVRRGGRESKYYSMRVKKLWPLEIEGGEQGRSDEGGGGGEEGYSWLGSNCDSILSAGGLISSIPQSGGAFQMWKWYDWWILNCYSVNFKRINFQTLHGSQLCMAGSRWHRVKLYLDRHHIIGNGNSESHMEWWQYHRKV